MRILLTALAAIWLAAPATADHCASWSSSEHTVAIDVYYVDHDPCPGECTNTLALYEEANAIEGLQRSDEVVDDTCHGLVAPDRLIEMIGWG